MSLITQNPSRRTIARLLGATAGAISMPAILRAQQSVIRIGVMGDLSG